MATDLSTAVAEKARPAAVSDLSGKASPTPSPGEGRLASLDTFRGFIMFWIIGGDALTEGLRALHPNALLNALVYELGNFWASCA